MNFGWNKCKLDNKKKYYEFGGLIIANASISLKWNVDRIRLLKLVLSFQSITILLLHYNNLVESKEQVVKITTNRAFLKNVAIYQGFLMFWM